MARRITRLIAEIQRDPFSGIGKPEPLKGELSVAAIDDEDRLSCTEQTIAKSRSSARYRY
jgi:toxin YoeB